MIVEPASDSKIPSLNTILRDIKVDRIEKEARELAKKYGYLPYMIQRYIDMIGFEKTIELLNTFENYEYHPTILCNILKTDCRKLINKLTWLGFSIQAIDWCDNCFIVTKSALKPSLGSTHEYLKGFYYVYRDPASLLASVVLNPEPGSMSLDMCAAPGGKSVHILILMKDKGLLVANDVSKSRIKSLTVNLFRMGFKSFIITSEDGIHLPTKLVMRFDYILLDAPCSAEGAIMFDKSRKTKTSQEDLAKLVFREITLLRSAIELAKPGAKIVYTTCSIAPEENEYVISRIIDVVGSRISIEKPEIDIGSKGMIQYRNIEFYSEVSKCIRIWPHIHRMEGYFVCVLRKNS